jgi:hypothetical protein
MSSGERQVQRVRPLPLAPSVSPCRLSLFAFAPVLACAALAESALHRLAVTSLRLNPYGIRRSIPWPVFTEHIVRAEWGGINGMWKAVDGAETGTPAWDGDPCHRGKSIEQIVTETWQEKEQVPPVAAPTWGGPLAFWIAALQANEGVLRALGGALERHDLEAIHYPHPISGPLDMRQRLEFLRFHLDRHRDQVEELKSHPAFPAWREDSNPAAAPRPPVGVRGDRSAGRRSRRHEAYV